MTMIEDVMKITTTIFTSCRFKVHSFVTSGQDSIPTEFQLLFANRGLLFVTEDAELVSEGHMCLLVGETNLTQTYSAVF